MENKKYDRLTKGLVYPLIEKYYEAVICRVYFTSVRV